MDVPSSTYEDVMHNTPVMDMGWARLSEAFGKFRQVL